MQETDIIQEISPGLYRTIINFEGNEKNSLNIYIVKVEKPGRSLMIDCGYKNYKCLEKFEEMFTRLDIDCRYLDIFITHSHPDHCGLAEEFSSRGARLMMNPVEEAHKFDLFHCYMAQDDTRKKTLRVIGVTPELTPEVYTVMMEYGREMFGKKSMYYEFDYNPVEQGQILKYGDYSLQVVGLRGHTYGQLGLYDKEHKLFFCADQILTGLVPIVGYVNTSISLLESYISSLDIIKHTYSDCLLLPSHFDLITDVGKEVDRIIFGYLDKCSIMKHILCEEGIEMTVRQVGTRAYGRGNEPPSKEKFWSCTMILAKTFACLEYLYQEGFISRREDNGIMYWKIK